MSRNQDIIDAPWLSLNAWPKEDIEELNQAVDQVLEAIKAGMARDTSQTYKNATTVILCNLMQGLSSFYRLRTSTSWNLKDLDNPAYLKQTQILKVIETLVAMGWIKHLDYVKEVVPLIKAKCSGRIEVLEACPKLNDNSLIAFHPNSEMVRISGNAGIVELGGYEEADKAADQELLSEYNQLLLNSTITQNDKLIPHIKPLARMFKVKDVENVINGRFFGGWWLSVVR